MASRASDSAALPATSKDAAANKQMLNGIKSIRLSRLACLLLLLSLLLHQRLVVQVHLIAEILLLIVVGFPVLFRIWDLFGGFT
eukprot:18204_5